MTPNAVKLERRRMRRKGFTAKAGQEISHVCDGKAHHVRIVKYRDEGVTKLYAEVWESHDRARRARIVGLDSLVHLLQNISPDEVIAISSRKKGK